MSPWIMRAMAWENYQVNESFEYFVQGQGGNSIEKYAEAAKTCGTYQTQQKIAALAHPRVHVWNARLMVAEKELAEKDLDPPR
eukprot:6943359-Pyramimonas_sp.AAC.1